MLVQTKVLPTHCCYRCGEMFYIENRENTWLISPIQSKFSKGKTTVVKHEKPMCLEDGQYLVNFVIDLEL